MERGFWLEMMEKYYHKLLSPPWAAAAGVIYELVYGLRHTGVIVCSSAVQCRLQPASAVKEGEVLLCSPTAGKRQAPTPDPPLLTPKRPTLGSSSRITSCHSSHSSHAVTEVTEVTLTYHR